jgi:hypothetical protein
MRFARKDFLDTRRAASQIPKSDVAREAAAAVKRAEELMADPKTATAAKAVVDMIAMAEADLTTNVNALVDMTLTADDVARVRDRAIRARSLLIGLRAALAAFLPPEKPEPPAAQ